MPRGDGNLYISFVSMGQGDCTIVSLPNGKTLMVDCGTARWNTDKNTGVNLNQTAAAQTLQITQLRQGVIDTLYTDRHLQNYNTIDALVMTHPDKDHCNELMSILTGNNPAITNLYYSYSSNGGLGLVSYVEGSAGAWLQYVANVTGGRYAVVINAAGTTLNGAVVPNAATAADVAVNRISINPPTQGFVKILHGTHANPGSKRCEVFLLAGDVTTYPGINDGSDQKNRGSVVTLIVYGNQKYMICGDATFNTEKFLKDTHGAKIQNLELVQVPHHGSLTSSSCSTHGAEVQIIKNIGFVNHVNPRGAIISAAVDSGSSLKLPRYETIRKYSTLAPGRFYPRLANVIDCWWHVPATYEDNPVGRKRKVLTDAFDQYGQQAVPLEIVTTAQLNTIEYDRTDADV